jgi:hypothetical protein
MKLEGGMARSSMLFLLPDEEDNYSGTLSDINFSTSGNFGPFTLVGEHSGGELSWQNSAGIFYNVDPSSFQLSAPALS